MVHLAVLRLDILQDANFRKCLYYKLQSLINCLTDVTLVSRSFQVAGLTLMFNCSANDVD